MKKRDERFRPRKGQAASSATVPSDMVHDIAPVAHKEPRSSQSPLPGFCASYSSTAGDPSHGSSDDPWAGSSGPAWPQVEEYEGNGLDAVGKAKGNGKNGGGKRDLECYTCFVNKNF